MKAWLLALVAACLALALFSPPAAAAPERFIVEMRVLKARPYEGGRASAKQVIDPQLSAWEKDLRALPFREITLADSQTTALRANERVSLELPEGRISKQKRFLQITSQGRKEGGKLRFQLTVDALKFNTLVAVPDGGTIFVAVPKKKGRTLIIAFTARST